MVELMTVVQYHDEILTNQDQVPQQRLLLIHSYLIFDQSMMVAEEEVGVEIENQAHRMP